MNHERNGKLLTLRDSGANSTLATGEIIKRFRAVRPDGGVVTQRTANPLSSAENRDSSHNSPSVPRISFQGLMRSAANSVALVTTSQSDAPNRHAHQSVGGCRKAGGAKSWIGDGAVSSELKAPFKSQSISPVVWEWRRIAYRTGAFKPRALTTPFAGTDKRERRARDTRRMVETQSGSMRSTGSPVGNADAPKLRGSTHG